MKILSEDHVYHELTRRLLERLDYIRIQPDTILIVSLYPQQSIITLKKRYPVAQIKTASDAAKMREFQDETVDLIISDFSLMREYEPLYFLHDCRRVLKTEGLLLLLTLGPDTLCELRHSFSVVDAYAHVHDFVDMHHVGDWLRELQFSDPVVDREEVVIAYDTLALFFDDLKSACATNVHQKRSRGLMTKNQWEKMLLQYAQLQADGVFPVTIELVYGHAWKVKIDDEDVSDVMISVDQIKRRGL